jgi:cysteine-rich repeat protein
MKMTKLLIALPFLAALACGDTSNLDDTLDAQDASFSSDGKSDAFGVSEGSYLALGVLGFVNSASLQELDDDAKLNATAARNIFDARDNGDITSLSDLDAIPYVGPSAFGALVTYVQANSLVPFCGDGTLQASMETCDDGNQIDTDGCSALCEVGNAVDLPPYQDTPIVYGFQEGSYEGLAILKTSNILSLEVLDIDAKLDVRAAKKIVYGRGAGFTSLTKLSEVAYVGPSAFKALRDYAFAQGTIPFCGDGAMQSVMEKCDDGNTTSGDGCDSACRLESTCGDGFVEFAETCDDGNDLSLDGCSSTCLTELKYETSENNYDKAHATEIGSYLHLSGTVRSEGDIDYWTFTVDRPGKVYLDVWGGNYNGACRSFYFEGGNDLFDPTLKLEGPDGSTSFSANCGSKRSDRNDEWDTIVDLVPGTYFIRLEGQDVGWGWDAPYTVSYQIEVVIELTGPVCGNGNIETSEQCDDGNSNNNDGCSQACGLEYKAEVEPNNALIRNTSLGTYQYGAGTVGVGDNDYFGFKVEIPGNVSISLDGGADCRFDGYLELYDATGTLIAQDDDSAGNYCPGLSKNLAVGSYFVNVRHSEPTVAGGSYSLNVER